MSRTNETPTAIVERKNRVGRTNMFKVIGLYLNENTVSFSANFSSPDESDVSYSYHYEFDVEEYKRGIIELKETGKCVLTATDKGQLTISSGSDGSAVGFHIPGYERRTNDLYPYSFSTDWTANQISLPGTPPSCQAEIVVPNVYEGEQWG